MRNMVIVAMVLLLSGCMSETDEVAACAEAISDIGNIKNIDAKCDHLSQENQRAAADMASKKNGLIIFLPPYEAKKARDSVKN